MRNNTNCCVISIVVVLYQSNKNNDMRIIFTVLIAIMINLNSAYSAESIQIAEIAGSGHYCQGEEITISCRAIGNDLHYKWFKDGALVDYPDLPIFKIETAGFDNTGTYSCTVYNETDALSSEKIFIFIDNNTQIIKQPENTYTVYGRQVSFSVSANVIDNQENTVDYQWYKDEIALSDSSGKYSGTHTNEFTISNTNENDTISRYWCKISGKCNTVSSEKAGFDFLMFKITYVTPDATVCKGDYKKLEVKFECNKNVKFDFQWYYNYEPIWRQNKSEYEIMSMISEDFGHYYLKITDRKFKSVYESPIIRIKYDTPPELFQPPSRDEYKFPEGGMFNFIYVYATAFQMGDIQYQWYKNGEEIEFQYKTVLIGRRVKMDDAGEYYCRVTNHCGSTYSKKIKLRVIPRAEYLSADDIENNGHILSAPTPNPAMDETSIKYYVPYDGNVKIRLLDVFGREIAVLMDEYQVSDYHTLSIDCNKLNVPSGMYIYTLETEEAVISNKILIIK